MRPWFVVAAFAVSSLVTAVPATATASEYVPLDAPARLVDTRPGAPTIDGQHAGDGLRPADSTLVVQVAGRAGIPTNAPNVVLNVAAVNPQNPGFITVHPTGTPRPNASNINYYPGRTIANTVVARLGTDGTVSIYTLAATHLVVDVAGHLPIITYAPLAAPARLVDTRPGESTIDGQHAGGGLRPADGTLVVQVAGRAGIPADTSTVVLNVAAVAPTGPGFITVHPTGTPRPNASNINHYHHTIANTVIARLGTDGTVSIYTLTPTHLVVDIAGHLPATTYTPLATPARLADTRPGESTIDGQHAGEGRVLGGHSLQLHVAGRAGLPDDASAVVLNVAAVAPTGPGFVTVHPTGTPRPNASNINHYGHTIANTVIARLGAGGDVCVYAHTATHLVVDLAGHLAGPAPPTAGPVCPPDQLPSWGPPHLAVGESTTPWDDSAATATGIATVSTNSVEEDVARSKLAFSTDATTWTTVDEIADVRLYSIVAGGPGFVAVGHETTQPGPFAPTVPAVWTSADGLGWASAPNIDLAGFEHGDMDDVAITRSGLIAVGSARNASGPNHPSVWLSATGADWDHYTPFGAYDDGVKVTVAASAERIVAVVQLLGENAPLATHAWWSPDGLTWMRAPDIDSFGPARASIYDLAAFGPRFVMVGIDFLGGRAPLVWTSPDGQTWNDPNPLPVRAATDWAYVRALGTDGNILVAAGGDVEFDPGVGPARSGASIWMSYDATSWVQVPPDALHGDVVLDAVGADDVVPFRDGWVVLGTTWAHDEGASASVVWRSVAT